MAVIQALLWCICYIHTSQSAERDLSEDQMVEAVKMWSAPELLGVAIKHHSLRRFVGFGDAANRHEVDAKATIISPATVWQVIPCNEHGQAVEPGTTGADGKMYCKLRNLDPSLPEWMRYLDLEYQYNDHTIEAVMTDSSLLNNTAGVFSVELHPDVGETTGSFYRLRNVQWNQYLRITPKLELETREAYNSSVIWLDEVFMIIGDDVETCFGCLRPLVATCAVKGKRVLDIMLEQWLHRQYPRVCERSLRRGELAALQRANKMRIRNLELNGKKKNLNNKEQKLEFQILDQYIEGLQREIDLGQ